MTDSSSEIVAVPKVNIDWYRAIPWWRIASMSIGISWRASHLILCAAGLLLTRIGIAICGWLFRPEVPLTSTLANHNGSLPGAVANNYNLPASLASNTTSLSLVDVWAAYIEPFWVWLANPSIRESAYCLCSAAIIIAVWSLIGGSIVRRALLEMGCKITAPWTATMTLVAQRALSIAWAVMMPIAFLAMIGLIPLVFGWISNIPGIGAWISAILMLPLIVLSVGLGWCASITLLGYPLSVAAIVGEKQADAFDGVSRSAAYCFQRPLTLALCFAAAQLISLIGVLVVNYVCTTGLNLVRIPYFAGSAHDHADRVAWLRDVLVSFPGLVSASFLFSFFWTAAAGIYLILRLEVDHAQFDQLDLSSEGEPQALKPVPAMPTTGREDTPPPSEPNASA